MSVTCCYKSCTFFPWKIPSPICGLRFKHEWKLALPNFIVYCHKLDVNTLIQCSLANNKVPTEKNYLHRTMSGLESARSHLLYSSCLYYRRSRYDFAFHDNPTTHNIRSWWRRFHHMLSQQQELSVTTVSCVKLQSVWKWRCNMRCSNVAKTSSTITC